MKQQQTGNVTGYLRSAAIGDPIADKQLFELIHADFKRMAHGRHCLRSHAIRDLLDHFFHVRLSLILRDAR